jgi:hypothetical protein
VTADQGGACEEQRRSEVIMAFLGAGLHQPLSRALALSALAGARRTVASLLWRGDLVADWLATETRLRGIRENAATLAVMELRECRHGTAEAFARDHPDRLDILRDLLAVLR